MGQRHQFFAIARIGNRYRTLAVVHNQWLICHSAVRQCLVTMRILSAPGNLPGLRRDLKSAASKPEDFWAKDKDRVEGADFSFMATCLLIGCGAHPDKRGPPSAMIMPLDTEYNGIQNDDGICVFDVTEPGRPRYAMMQLHDQYKEDYETDSNEPVDSEGDSEPNPGKTIFNASEYEKGYPRGLRSDGSDDWVQSLDSLPLLDVEALHSAWPQAKFYPRASNAATEAGAEDHTNPATAVRGPGASKLDYLATLNLAKAGVDDDISMIEDEVPIPRFKESLGAVIYANPGIVRDRRHLNLLRLVLKGYSEVDLSPFDNISPKEILHFSRLLAKDTSSNISLSLPDLEQSLTSEDIRTLLRENRWITELHVGQSKMAELEATLEGIDGSRVERLSSPEMYSRSFFNATPEWLRGYEVRDGRMQTKPWKSPVPALQLPEQFPVVQLVMAYEDSDKRRRRRLAETFPAEVPHPREDDDALVSLPLSDSFLSPMRAVASLPAVFSRLVLPAPLGVCFLVGKAIRGLTYDMVMNDDLKIMPLPGELSAWTARFCASSPAGYVPTAPLRHGEWTIIISKEHTCEDSADEPLKLSCGFASLDASGKTQVLTPADFLKSQSSRYDSAEIEAAISVWEGQAASLIRELDEKQRESAERRAENGPRPDAQLILCSADEVDLIFKNLGILGRLATATD